MFFTMPILFFLLDFPIQCTPCIPSGCTGPTDMYSVYAGSFPGAQTKRVVCTQ